MSSVWQTKTQIIIRFGMEVSNIAVFGSSGSLGNAFTKHFAVQYPEAVIYAFSCWEQAFDNANVLSHSLNYQDEGATEKAIIAATAKQPFDIVIVATAVSYDDVVTPEKSLKHLSIQRSYRHNPHNHSICVWNPEISLKPLSIEYTTQDTL